MAKKAQRQNILKPDKSYTFRSYFLMKFAPTDILQELGVKLTKTYLKLPKFDNFKVADLANLGKRLEQGITRVSLTSEAARREVLIAPVLLEVANLAEARINIEYPVEINQFLRGELDYLLQSKSNLIVVEAKQADLTRGFTQLAAELIALDSWLETDESILYGAVTTGDIWQLGSFNRQERLVSQDLMLYRVPTDLEILMGILVGILMNTESLHQVKS